MSPTQDLPTAVVAASTGGRGFSTDATTVRWLTGPSTSATLHTWKAGSDTATSIPIVVPTGQVSTVGPWIARPFVNLPDSAELIDTRNGTRSNCQVH